MKVITKFLTICFAITLLASCGSDRNQYVKSPIDDIITQNINEQNYSVVLADMNYDENQDSYYHKYKIIIAKSKTTANEVSENDFKVTDTEWKKVSVLLFEKYQNDLGMTILSKKNGVLDKKSAPAGYDNYVGNQKYGHWQTGNNGTSFWAFYGQYAFMRSMFGWNSGYRYYRNDYSNYSTYRGRQNYYGKNNTFGTKTYKNNSSTWAKKPQSFKQKVQSKVKRSASSLKSTGYSSNRNYGNSTQKTTRNTNSYSNSSSYRARSGGFGK